MSYWSVHYTNIQRTVGFYVHMLSKSLFSAKKNIAQIEGCTRCLKRVRLEISVDRINTNYKQRGFKARQSSLHNDEFM